MKNPLFEIILLTAHIPMGRFQSCNNKNERSHVPNSKTSLTSDKASNGLVQMANSGTKIRSTRYTIFLGDMNAATKRGLNPKMINCRFFDFISPKISWARPTNHKYCSRALPSDPWGQENNTCSSNESAPDGDYVTYGVEEPKKSKTTLKYFKCSINT